MTPNQYSTLCEAMECAFAAVPMSFRWVIASEEDEQHHMEASVAATLGYYVTMMAAVKRPNETTQDAARRLLEHFLAKNAVPIAEREREFAVWRGEKSQ